MNAFHFSIDDILDFYTLGNFHYLSEVFQSMRQEILNGMTIIIERRFTNAPNETMRRITSNKELEFWIKEQFPQFEEPAN